MRQSSHVAVLLAAISIGASPAICAEEAVLGEIVVTAPRMLEPLTVELDPKAPQQPVPANDGASFLKNVPGFNVIRKGGTDGDPVLRGLAGSRLNVLIDGAELLGGCGMRMDPPTAYVFPETFDKVTVIKGPQSVQHGNGNLAGVVLFERDPKQVEQPGARGFASLMAGSWGWLDGVAGGTIAGDKGYLQATATHAESDDYEDGDSKKVHSAYERKSLNVVGGYRPDAHTRIELSAVGSRAEAAYADRSMDGVKFDREGYGLKFEKTDLTPLVQKLTAQAYYNYIDHVMDNFSLRTKPAMMNYMSNNPDRETQGVRVSGDLAATPDTLLTLGADWQENIHTLRKYSNAAQQNIESFARARDMDSSIAGLYGELRHQLSARSRLIGGLRYDRHEAQRYANAFGGVDAGIDEGLKSGFIRYEQDLAGQPATAYVGLGHAQRPMDFWEASTYNGILATGQLEPEKNSQLDAGVIWKTNTLSGSVSAFYGKVDDYILTYTGGSASPYLSNCAASMGTYYCSGNVDATRWGGEADSAWRFAPQWTLRGALAWVHSDNDTLDVPLAQTPPLEGRVGLDYTTGPWTFGGIFRMVAEQDRIHPSYGNIVGQDLATPTDGFTTLALNASYKPGRRLLASFGVDNVFDKAYAEHISRAGAMVSGYAQTSRVNESGRFIWAKLNLNFD